jgi:hypothetical protein
MHIGFWLKHLNRGGHFEDLCVDGSVILQGVDNK